MTVKEDPILTDTLGTLIKIQEDQTWGDSE